MKRIKYRHRVIIILSFLLYPAVVHGFEQEIVLGREDNWKDFISLTEIIKKPGKWDTFDLALSDAEGTAGPSTDLLIHFNSIPLADEAGNYIISGKKIMISDKDSIFGKGSGLFEREKYSLVLKPGKNALFAAGTLWGDFTLEFRMQPVTLNDSEIIFSWSGSRLIDREIRNQSLRCTLSDRTCLWEFKNFFLSSSGKESYLSLKGLTPLLPRKWHHHMLRYDSAVGLLEYLVDGIPEAILYTTGNDNGKGTVHLPYIGEIFSGEVKIGEYFTGLIDEFSLSAEFSEKLVRQKYEGIKGVGISKVFDTKHTGSSLKKISAVYTKPAETDIYFYYRIADVLHLWDDLGGEWVQFNPGQVFDPGTRGRYLQLLIELFPNGDQSESPLLSSMTITYEPDLPPPPPPEVFAIAGNQKVTLYWKKVNYQDVAGYEIYYGERSGYYYGKGSSGPEDKTSPINAGNVTEYEISGLENGKIYYFTIVAYDSSDIPHKSIFSKEVHARPSGLLH
ncbi:MAG: hypothetical protein JXJ04_06745 [Spirochaetales bacterium]|nr:hypothetical protein [Spirochaetales bacterium]